MDPYQPPSEVTTEQEPQPGRTALHLAGAGAILSLLLCWTVPLMMMASSILSGAYFVFGALGLGYLGFAIAVWTYPRPPTPWLGLLAGVTVLLEAVCLVQFGLAFPLLVGVLAALAASSTGAAFAAHKSAQAISEARRHAQRLKRRRRKRPMVGFG